jgi:predicted secreted hydrolase
MHYDWKKLSAAFAMLFVLSACGNQQSFEPSTRLSAVEAVSGYQSQGFAIADTVREFRFPADHGAHPEYATEWWYYTGNLENEQGDHFGYQLTFFRSGLSSEPVSSESTWENRNIYMAHLAVVDQRGDTFFAYERFSRDAAGLAGAEGDPFRVWLDDWSASGSGPEGMSMQLKAAEGQVALDLTLISRHAPVLQGNQGLSQKSNNPQNASYYYSLTRLETSGTLTSNGVTHQVHGTSWMDHEFSSSALDDQAQGWDWFGLPLDNGQAFTFARIHDVEGNSIYALGSLTDSQGQRIDFDPNSITLTPLGQWSSPTTGVSYPSGWRLQSADGQVDIEVKPLRQNQELLLTILYWEGAAQVSGSINGQAVTGHGYVELTGYNQNSNQGIRIR